MDSVHLIGAEDVVRAGHNISGAAETISRAAMGIDNTIERMMPGLGEAVGRFEEAVQKLTPGGAVLSRDEFAAEAMKAMIASGEEFTTTYVLQALGLPTATRYDPEVHYPAFLAKRAYAHADAMLKARVAHG